MTFFTGLGMWMVYVIVGMLFFLMLRAITISIDDGGILAALGFMVIASIFLTEFCIEPEQYGYQKIVSQNVVEVDK